MPDGMTDLEQRRAGPISEAYNMDCMEYMRQFPDKHFELSVVDPPYGIGEDGRKSQSRRVRSDKWKNPKKAA